MIEPKQTRRPLRDRDEKCTEVKKIVRVYMTEQGGVQVSLRMFAEMLNEPFTEQGLTGCSHQTIHNWIHQKHLPLPRWMEQLKYFAQPEDWQYKFACDLEMAAI